MKVLRRICIALGLVGLITSAAVVLAPQASASIMCHTTMRHYSWWASGISSVKLGWFDLHVEVCTNGNSITSSNAWDSHGETTAASLLFVRVSLGQPYRTGFYSGGFSGGKVGYRADGSIKVCAPVGPFSICSASENFKLTGAVAMLNQLIIRPTGDQFVLNRRVFDPNYTWACTNDKCNGDLHM